MKYVIKLRSVYTGDEIWLGSQYDSYKEAETYAEREVCRRCNSISIVQIPDGLYWSNKHMGFMARDASIDAIKRKEKHHVSRT